MASLTKKKINGRIYYYARECKRVNGKPKIVWQASGGKPVLRTSITTMSPEQRELYEVLDLQRYTSC